MMAMGNCDNGSGIPEIPEIPRVNSPEIPEIPGEPILWEHSLELAEPDPGADIPGMRWRREPMDGPHPKEQKSL